MTDSAAAIEAAVVELGPRKRTDRLSWSEAKALAPWPVSDRESEQEWRQEFAAGLVRGQVALVSRASTSTGERKDPGRLLHQPPPDLARQDRIARKAGLSWTAWVRKVLGRAVARSKG